MSVVKEHLNDFKCINFYERLSGPKLAVMAEVKRASPSKGDIAPNIDAAKQGLLYAKAGTKLSLKVKLFLHTAHFTGERCKLTG